MARIKVGDKIDDLKLPTIDGKTFDISEHKGKNIFIEKYFVIISGGF